MKKQTRQVTISICVPVSFTLDVSWDDEEYQFDIARIVRESPVRLSVKNLIEHMSEDEWDWIDRQWNDAKESK